MIEVERLPDCPDCRRLRWLCSVHWAERHGVTKAVLARLTVRQGVRS